MKQVLTKLGLALILFLANHTMGLACWQGCVIDKCSGLPLAYFPITYHDPNAHSGIGGWTKFITDDKGCFSYNGAVGSSIQLGGLTYTYNGGPCVQLGNVPALALTGGLILGSTTLHTGDIADLDVANYKVNGCETNNLTFGYMAPGIDLTKYCLKVEIFRLNLYGLPYLAATIDWTQYMTKDGMKNFNFSDILKDFSPGTYRIRVQIKCCDDKSYTPINGYSSISGNFTWTPNLKTGDVEFAWMGSSFTESVNNDGNPDDYRHPNNGNTYSLGQLSAGVNWNIIPGSGAVSQVKTKLYQINSPGTCSGDGDLIWQKTWAPPTGSAPNNFNFNAEMNSQTGSPYFLLGTGYTPGVTCFKFIVEVVGSPNCPPLTKVGFFRIAAGNPFGRISGGDHISTQSMSDNIDLSNGDLEARLYQKGSEGIEVYPNPVSDQLHILGWQQVKSATIMDSGGRTKIAALNQGVLDVSSLTSGIYMLRFNRLDGKSIVKRFVKH